MSFVCFFFFFFFQAEDGIRDGTVTGVQTCALPIYSVQLSEPTGGGPDQTWPTRSRACAVQRLEPAGPVYGLELPRPPCGLRSEERRVGKECRSWWSTYDEKRKKDGRCCGEWRYSDE